MNIAVFVSGGGTNLQAIIDEVKFGSLTNVKIKIVIASKDDIFAIKRSKNENIPCKVISKKEYSNLIEYDKALIQALKEYNIDLVVLAGFLSRIGSEFISFYKNKIINIHPSLIPAFCGNGMYGIIPHVEVIRKGVMITGATVHFVDEDYDNGPILLQKAVRVFSSDTPQILQKRVMDEAEHVILPLSIKLISENKVKIIDGKAKIEDDDFIPYIV